MKQILITGATGNTGYETIRYLFKNQTQNHIIAGVRNINKAKKKLKAFPSLEYTVFDFEKPETFHTALQGITSVFLLRPPHISDIKSYFQPLIAKISEKGVREIVFLSVQGAAKSRIIPHNKIERLIREYQLNYIFLRPSYFMQNLTTTLVHDIRYKRRIILPAGKAKLNWIDVQNIGETSAILLEQFNTWKNNAYDLTGMENENFYKIAEMLSEVLGEKTEYKNVNPLRFYWIKKQEELPKGMIMVMIMLHFLPRFQKEPEITGFYQKLTGKTPATLKTFVQREKGKFDPILKI